MLTKFLEFIFQVHPLVLTIFIICILIFGSALCCGKYDNDANNREIARKLKEQEDEG
jgi:hypothetical protein